MAEELEVTPGGPSAGSSAAPAPQYDPDYVARLERYYQEVQPFIAQIQPVYEDLRPLIEDEGQRQFYIRARDAYQRSQEEQKPKLSPEQQAIVDELMPYVKEPADYVKQLREEQERQQARQQKEFADANLAYGQKLLQESALGQTHQERLARISRIANYGAANGQTLEQAHKELYGDITPPPPPVQDEAVPSRAGVPPKPKAHRDPEEPIDVFSLVRDSVVAAQKSRAS